MKTSLIHLPHNITVVDAHYVQPGIACLYIVTQGSRVSIIETGTALSVPFIISALDELGFTCDDVDYVIPTHIHLDHAGGAGDLIELCSNAQLVVHPRGAAHMINPEKLEAGTIAVYGEDAFRKLYGALKPIPADRVIIAEDNFELDFNGRFLKFIDTPGHALHHFSVYDELSKGIFTGDSFGLSYLGLTSPEDRFLFATTTPVHFDPETMLASIDRLLLLNPEVVYLTHFGAIQPTEKMVAQLKRSITAFVGIAKQEQKKQEGYGEGRKQRIQHNIMQWILDELQKYKGELSSEACRKMLENDSILNAQGLEVWLQRMKKRVIGK